MSGPPPTSLHPHPQATVLSGAQASQLIARLREAQLQQQRQQQQPHNGPVTISMASGSGTHQQTIKIQAVQTNPQTGMRQIIAIPINAVQATTAGGNAMTTSIVTAGGVGGFGVLGQQKLTVSPMKVKTGGLATSAAAAVNPQHVKVVKLASSSSLTNAGGVKAAAIFTQAGGIQVS
jgi:hypothetical protein